MCSLKNCVCNLRSSLCVEMKQRAYINRFTYFINYLATTNQLSFTPYFYACVDVESFKFKQFFKVTPKKVRLI